MDDTIKQVQGRRPARASTPTLMDTAQVIPQFTKAAAAGDVPDVQFLFNGIYHMENAWLGYLKPLNGLVSADDDQAGRRHDDVQLPGQAVPHGLLRARLRRRSTTRSTSTRRASTPDAPPTTWDAFMDACDKLKAKGYIPLGGGIKDGFLGEWWLVNALTQNLNSAGRRAQPVHRQARLARRRSTTSTGQARRSSTKAEVLERRRHARSSSTRASSFTTPARRRWPQQLRRRCPNSQKKLGRERSAS